MMDVGTGITVVVVVAFSLWYFYDLGRRHERREWLEFVERHYKRESEGER